MSDDLAKLAKDLSKAAVGASVYVRKAIEVSARNVKDRTADDYKGATALPGASRSISYDIHDNASVFGGGTITAEVGPRLGGQGSLVGMIEVGTPTTAPRQHLLHEMEAEQGDYVRGLEKAIVDTLRARGL